MYNIEKSQIHFESKQLRMWASIHKEKDGIHCKTWILVREPIIMEVWNYWKNKYLHKQYSLLNVKYRSYTKNMSLPKLTQFLSVIQHKIIETIIAWCNENLSKQKFYRNNLKFLKD